MKSSGTVIHMVYHICSVFVVCLVLGGFCSTGGSVQHQISDDGVDIYIVHVSPLTNTNGLELSQDHYAATYHYHQSFVSGLISSATAVGVESSSSPIILHSYRHVISGFAAKLTPEMVSEMSRKEGFISASPQKVYHLQTTHSPDFLGLLRQDVDGFWQKSSGYGKGVIVGLLDTGITPNHPSFSDEGISPPPPKWKGTCDSDVKASCNNKLIGARSFIDGSSSLDEEGHGTHTSGTVAGNFVKDASVFGNANGTASGMAPLAHVAMYTVCDMFGCVSSAILAGMDAAIEDGVDVLSVSLGGASLAFFDDVIAMGTFAAMRKGIFVSCAAGNSGPDQQTLSNEAPWLLTVGASTIDRRIMATLILGNKVELEGESVNQAEVLPLMPSLPLVYPKNDETFCESLDGTDVKGKVVVCERGGGVSRVGKGGVVKAAGGAAMVLVNDKSNGDSILADPHVLPATELSYNDGLKVKAYVNSTSSPTATIAFKGTVIGEKNAPAVASFSSRGPNQASPGILKPDIIGPGVNILAAWPDSVDNDIIKMTMSNSSPPKFNMISGTSMACPHLSGLAALLKSAHPTWSPAAIKSAIMTTAYQNNLNGDKINDETSSPADFFATGAGHVNPGRANDPGLVYDMQPDDYIPYLCGLNYTDQHVQMIVQQKVNCSNVTSIREAQLNYPSFAIQLGTKTQLTFSRTVTNVGDANSTYVANITTTPGVDVEVTPKSLIFRELNQKLSYNITFARTSNKGFSNGDSETVQGAISWVSSKNIVRSPIVIAPLGLRSIIIDEKVGVDAE
ncbi:unnamed protein product [Cuscuta epithymum]|uniref:Uncharacterized protein n=1 Tax=Cuscuta epithymum TaxID=186058 RepID=A0AAV0CLS3_9ASTE|nr:unnamed protein product [Cuscuta epithymum]